jgi:hypothetical protein
MADLTTICFKLKPPDLQLLEACERAEQLTRSDVLRRAIRSRARELGVVEADRQPRRRKR